MPCDICPTKSQQGEWAQLTCVTGDRRGVTVLCPTCHNGVWNKLNEILDEQQRRAKAERCAENLKRLSDLVALIRERKLTPDDYRVITKHAHASAFGE